MFYFSLQLVRSATMKRWKQMSQHKMLARRPELVFIFVIHESAFQMFCQQTSQSCLRSSVVERVTSNDEAVSSILAEGILFVRCRSCFPMLLIYFNVCFCFDKKSVQLRNLTLTVRQTLRCAFTYHLLRGTVPNVRCIQFRGWYENPNAMISLRVCLRS